jgi:hypothetical protein
MDLEHRAGGHALPGVEMAVAELCQAVEEFKAHAHPTLGLFDLAGRVVEADVAAAQFVLAHLPLPPGSAVGIQIVAPPDIGAQHQSLVGGLGRIDGDHGLLLAGDVGEHVLHASRIQ